MTADKLTPEATDEQKIARIRMLCGEVRTHPGATRSDRDWAESCECLLDYADQIKSRLDASENLVAHLKIERDALAKENADLRAKLDQAVGLLLILNESVAMCPFCEGVLTGCDEDVLRGHEGDCALRTFLVEHPRQGATLPKEKGAEDES